MKAFAKLLLVGIVGMVLVAPPAYPQDQKVLIQNLSVDMINLKNTLKQVQDSSEQRNTETTKLLQDVLKSFTEVQSRFSTIDSSVQRLNEALSGLKANDDKNAKDLQEARTSLENLRKEVDSGFTSLNNQARSLTQAVNNLKTQEQPLPAASAVFSQAYSDFNSGLYSLAIPEFRDFISKYKGDARAAAAQYYIGEAFFAQKKYEDALKEYETVLTDFPDSDKKCSALYRKGQTFVEQKQIPQAKTALQTVVKECPMTQEAANATADLKKPLLK